MPPQNRLKWSVSYETLLFQTLDGDINNKEYAIHPNGGWCVRIHPKNNHNFVITHNPDDLIGKREVLIRDTKGGYYDEFILPNGRSLRVKSSKLSYNKLREVVDHPIPQKEVDNLEITRITKDDHLWQ